MEFMMAFLFVLAVVSMVGAFIVLWIDYRQKEKDREEEMVRRLKSKKQNADFINSCIKKNREEIAQRMEHRF